MAPASARHVAPPIIRSRTPPPSSDHEMDDLDNGLIDNDENKVDDDDDGDGDGDDNDRTAKETVNESDDSSHSASEDVAVGKTCKRSRCKDRKLQKKKLADYETNAEK